MGNWFDKALEILPKKNWTKAYKKESDLGYGGFGKVIKARSLKNEKVYAIKFSFSCENKNNIVN